MQKILILLCLIMSSFVFSQQTQNVDFTHLKADISVHPYKKKVTGKVTYKLNVLQRIDSVAIDAQKMKIHSVLVNNKKVDVSVTDKQLIVYKKFKENKLYTISLQYEATPKKAIYFLGWQFKNASAEIQKQVWTQGQGKYTSNWLPSFDDMNEKLEFDLSFTFDKNYEVISNGKLVSVKENDSLKTWHYDMQKPMSSYLVALAIGKYDVYKETSKSGVPLKLYYYPKDSLKVEPTYRYTLDIFDFFEYEIGVPYPWQNYKQIPVHDFLYAGMENTSATIFSDAFVVDNVAFNDKNYVNVNAHELAHQWFGDLVTEESGTHHWLQEGFATYYALLAERLVFGDAYYYWRLYEYAEELKLQDDMGQGTALLNPKASSTTFYKRGAFVLHQLRQLIGEERFKEAVKRYLTKYRFKNVTTAHFFDEVEYLTGEDFSEFIQLWLKTKTFPYEAALKSIKHSVMLQEYEMVDCEAANSRCDNHYLTSGVSDEAKIKVISQRPEKVTQTVFKNPLKVRQAIAQYVKTIKPSIKKDYESLLNDASYKTIEYALYHLWTNFPEDRKKYLDKTKEIIGLSDKNVRLLWLALALHTPNYNPSLKPDYLKELRFYTNPRYSFEVRQNAFSYLMSLDAFDKQTLINLKTGTYHHNWRFKTFSKSLIKKLSEKEEYKELLKD